MRKTCDYAKECKEIACASSQLVKDLKGDVERACVMCEKLQEDCVCTEVRYEVSVDNIKDNLCIVI